MLLQTAYPERKARQRTLDDDGVMIKLRISSWLGLDILGDSRSK
jgi:hypothetical protein